jgi:hypothetical protein
MRPEMHYELMIDRVADFHEEAANHRRAREVRSNKKAPSAEQRIRAVFRRFRAS